ncbi:MAG: hypothetical protein V1893_00190 [Candidatus Omnitrophota bacterium]
MEENSIFLIGRVVFSLCALVSLVCILNAKAVSDFSARWDMWWLRLFGFEAEIKTTPRTLLACRLWNVFMCLVFIILAVLL